MSCFSLAYGQLTLKRVLGEAACDHSPGMTQPAEVSLARIVCTLFMLARSSTSPSRTWFCRLISSMCLRRRMCKLLGVFPYLDQVVHISLTSTVEVVSSEVTLSYVFLLQNKIAQHIHAVSNPPPTLPPFFSILHKDTGGHLQAITFFVQLSYITITLFVFFKHFPQPKYSKLDRPHVPIVDNSQDCVAISPGFRDGRWIDELCEIFVTHPFICEKFPGMSMEPPSFFYM